MKDPRAFYTLKGYAINREQQLTYAMEDYLEMIARLSEEGKAVHIGEIAAMLHVSPSSASKMVNRLAGQHLVDCKPYGSIALSETGQQLGAYLLYRHDIIEQFLRWLNHSEQELEQTEKIEHFLNRETVYNLERLIRRTARENRE